MNLDFNKEQYAKLMKLTAIWEYVVNWFKQKSEMDFDAEKLVWYLVKNALDFWIKTDQDKLYDETLDIIEQFSMDSFADWFIWYLSRRDFIDKYWMKAIEEMTTKERIQKESEYMEIREEELSNNWIDRIWIVK